MNFKIISSNVEEALEELKNISKEVHAEKMDEVEFQIALQHVYHHLNVAWNARYASSESYRNMSDQNFKEWGSFPKDISFEEK